MKSAVIHDPTNAEDPALRAEFDGFFAAMGQGTNAYLERIARGQEVRRLGALSDAALARHGIRRDEIVPHVFRDLFDV